MNTAPPSIRLASPCPSVGPTHKSRAVSTITLRESKQMAVHETTSHTATKINGMMIRQKMRPAHRLMTFIVGMIGRGQAVISSGVSPGFSIRRSAINSPVMSNAPSSGSLL